MKLQGVTYKNSDKSSRIIFQRNLIISNVIDAITKDIMQINVHTKSYMTTFMTVITILIGKVNLKNNLTFSLLGKRQTKEEIQGLDVINVETLIT